MKTILQRHAKIPAVIGVPVEGAVVDGVQEYAEVAAEVRVLEADSAVQDAFGGVRMRRRILVSPDSSAGKPPCGGVGP
jgi:hypothetical protein